MDLKSRVLGIEPSANLTEIAREKGVEVVNRYFNPETAAQVREKYGPASIITSTNTFNHIDDLHGFMSGVSTLLDAKGIFVIEVPHSLDLVTKNQFDTVYHEHLSEFSVRSLAYLYEYFDIEIFDIQRLPIHGGSMRVLAQRKQGGHTISPQVAEWRSTEDKAALSSKQTYDDFAKRVRLNKAEMLTLLKGLKAQGKSLAGYGAPAKGNTLLNFYGIGPDLLDFVADRNPLKQGLYSPGMHIPVTPTEEILKRQPDYMLILAWNFAEEVMREQAEYRRRGGSFIIPIPSLQIVH